MFSYGIICCEMNWRVPSDPDYLQRNHRFEVAFDKLSSKYINTLLGKIAQFCCQVILLINH